MDALNTQMTSLHISKIIDLTAYININKFKNFKLELESDFLASNVLVQSIFVKCDDC